MKRPKLKPSLESLVLYNDYWLIEALKITKDRTRADDLVQEMYLKMHKRFLVKPPKIINFSYVLLTLKNLYLNEINKNKREIPNSNSINCYVDLDAEETKNKLEARIELNENLKELNYVQREVIMQLQEKSQRQLSRETGVGRDRLRKHYKEGLKTLKKIYEQE